MAGGVTSTGFVPTTYQEFVAAINALLLSTIDPGLDLDPDQPMGQIVSIFSKKLAESDERLATAYNAFNRAAAEGFLLDAIGLLTGTLRLPATKGTVVCTLGLDASTTVPAGSVANVAGQPANTWELLADVVSTSAGSYTGTFRSTQTGPVAANAGTLTVITTPVAGWNTVTNAADATVGTNVETDAQYRLRQIQELAAAGACTVDAIRADVLRVQGVEQCIVLENTTLTTDGNGVPGKAFEVVLWDGPSPAAANGDIAQAIWNDKPSGIQAYGTTSSSAFDSQGNTHTVQFTRATNLPIYFTYVLSVDSTFPIDGDTQVKNLVVAQMALQQIGKPVVALTYKALPLRVQGVLDVTSFFLGTAPSPSGTVNINPTTFQQPTTSTSNIGVTP